MQRSSDQIRDANIAAMGEKLGAIYSALWQEVGGMNSDWAEYVSLFGKSPKRVDLLNRAAGHFFRAVQDSLWERTLLKIARITDPATLGKRSNLSLRMMASTVMDPALRSQVEAAVEVAEAKCAFARDWRNRHIAHADLELSLDAEVKPLAPASRKMAVDALRSIEGALNCVSMSILGSTTRFDEMVLMNSGEDLIYLIDFALRKKDERRSRFDSGAPTDEDLAELRHRDI